ncbi:MAG: hypothetical protein R8M11_05520 [Gallionella sp.]
MKISTLVVSSLFLATMTGTASAAPTVGKYGINVDLTNSTTVAGTPSIFMIKGKYVMTKDTAILAGFGMQMVDTGAATNSKNTDIGFMFGIRQYMKTKQFSPFLGGKIQYLSTRQGTTDVTDLGLLIEAGAEYFLAKQFSLEGSVGGGYVARETQPAAGGATTKASNIGTISYNLSANYYF